MSRPILGEFKVDCVFVFDRHLLCEVEVSGYVIVESLVRAFLVIEEEVVGQSLDQERDGVIGGVAPFRWVPYLLGERRSTMPPTRPPYPPEFKKQMVELVRAGRTPGELAKEFEPSDQTIRNWVVQADRDEGLREDGLTSDEREELRRLRREIKQLRIEREILSKAAAWFAQETNTIPRKPSSS